MKVLSDDVDKAGWRCKLIDPAMPQNVTIVETPAGIQTCRHLTEIESSFLKNVSTSLDTLNTVEAIYRNEQQKQKIIVSEASRLQ